MSKSTPSLLALLGLVAVAGFQNRGRISEMLTDAQQKSGSAGTGTAAGSGGFLAELGQIFQGGQGEPGNGGGTSAKPVSAALSDLVNRFRDSGQGAAAESWVSAGANMPVDVTDLERALGDDTLDELARKTGMTRSELLLRLNTALPQVVDRFTPEGRLPGDNDADRLA